MAKLCFLSVQYFALSHNALRLAEAVSVAAEARRNQEEPVMAAPPKSVGAAIEQATQKRRQQPDGSMPPDELSFEALFRQAARPVVAEETPG